MNPNQILDDMYERVQPEVFADLPAALAKPKFVTFGVLKLNTLTAYVGEVVIGCGTDVIARRRRSYEKADMVFDPMHFLPLLEQKVGALDQAASLQGWDLPGAFATLHRLLEARMGKKSKREYVQIMRLLETFEMDHVHGALRQTLELGAIGYDAAKNLVLCRIERRTPRLDLDIHPYLPRARVQTTQPASYMSLVPGATS